jgi:MoaA/NifB/PqqE/SkfB family radical SAM enzyme
MGFRQLCVITNGSRTADLDYIRQLMDSGLNEILLSIHGFQDEHDTAVCRNKAWAYVEKTVENAKKLGIRLRTNTVVSALNYKSLIKTAGYLRDITPAASNFICFNDWSRAGSLTQNLACKYSEAQKSVKSAIDCFKENVSKVTVRYIPFCFMNGYEKHVCDILQNEYDRDEWINPVKRVVTYNEPNGEEAQLYYKKLYKQFLQFRGEALMGCETNYTAEELDNASIFNDLPASYIYLANRVDNARLRATYVKSDACKQCSRNLICDGLEKTYADIIGTSELAPVPGELIKDYMHFRRDYSRSWL